VAIAAWHPDYAFQVSFASDPNDPAQVPVWVDLTNKLKMASAVSRGRQYELDQNQASAPGYVLDDLLEYLNAANTASPYYPNVVPYREQLWQCMWPNGGTGNLLNSGGQGVVYDPTFETGTAGTTPTWVTAVGSSSPTVVATPT